MADTQEELTTEPRNATAGHPSTTDLPGRFFPPGTRKGNRGYMWRGNYMGREYEFACRNELGLATKDAETAEQYVRAFLTTVAQSPLVGDQDDEPEEEGEYVYFIAAGDEAIKIGLSRGIPKRLSALATGNHRKLRLLCAVLGDLGVERRLHERFAGLRISGEWFRPGPELLAFIEGINFADERAAA